MKDLKKILDSLSELVYVSELDTYEMLYINPSGRDFFHAPDCLNGQKCYRMLQHRESPCPFCTNAQLVPGKILTWEFTNPIINCHFLLKDQIIDWNGRKARLEIAFNMTSQHEEKLELKNRLDIEHLIINCSHQLFQSGELRSAAYDVMQEIGTYLQAARCYLVVLREMKTEWVSEWCAQGETPRVKDFALIDREIQEFFHRNGTGEEIYVVEDTELMRTDYPKLHERLSKRGVQQLVVTPLEKDGALVGLMGLDNPSIERYRYVRDIFHTLRYFISMSICREQDTQQLSYLSYRDPLTGLYNRNRFTQDTQALARQSLSIGVLYMNINGLKEINEQQGHSFGDQVIINYANRIQGAFFDDAVYRIGGDEFAVISHTDDELDFHKRAIEFREQSGQNSPCTIAIGHHWTIESASIFASVAVAGAMMYEEKRKHYLTHADTGRYRPQNDPAIAMNSAEKLQGLIQEGRMLVYLQPKFAFADCTLAGAEAVVRFLSDDGTVLFPGKFLPALEELRLIPFVDFYVFEQVCAKIRDWTCRGLPLVPIAVNFSRHSLTEINFISRLNELCHEYGISKSLLEIEITESVESVAGFNLRVFNTQLQSEGFKVVIDDFGARYANLALLTSAPFDKLKIDKSLIDAVDLNEKAKLVVQSLAYLCNNLKISTTVEGVETQPQYDVLKDMGFHEVQGFLFCRPIPIEQFERKYLSAETSAVPL